MLQFVIVVFANWKDITTFVRKLKKKSDGNTINAANFYE